MQIKNQHFATHKIEFQQIVIWDPAGLKGPWGVLMSHKRFWGVPGLLRRYSKVLKQSWGGPEGSWGVLWGRWVRKCNDGLKVSQGVLRSPRVPEGSKRFREVLKGPMGLCWTIGPLMKYLHPSNPYDISRTLRTLQDTSNPTGFLRTPWTPGPPGILGPLRTISGPLQDRFRNSEYPLSYAGTPQNPSGPIRTL